MQVLADQRSAAASLGKRSDDVVQKNLTPQLAFERFAGKVFDTSSSDFSDRVVKAQLRHLSSRTGYSSLHPLGSTKQSLFESPIERYNRLQHEIRVFHTELDAIAKT